MHRGGWRSPPAASAGFRTLARVPRGLGLRAPGQHLCCCCSAVKRSLCKYSWEVKFSLKRPRLLALISQAAWVCKRNHAFTRPSCAPGPNKPTSLGYRGRRMSHLTTKVPVSRSGAGQSQGHRGPIYSPRGKGWGPEKEEPGARLQPSSGVTSGSSRGQGQPRACYPGPRAQSVELGEGRSAGELC